ncbi:hypothetical protein [Bradyrhizobium sp. ORS 285]|uniref:hypothetical protein n=1 Tax=Bradyrhizobium sp. ORS 285 TaxID=115808 RepID=UPI000B409472|nr:hypothetical protein [Bradyrhizobium sp. ORS 285]
MSIVTPTTASMSRLRKAHLDFLLVLKWLGVALTIAVAASSIYSASKWSERRGVFDDIGYLRQAHLFQRFGLDGIDTDFARDDDNYFKDAATAIRPIEPNDPGRPFAHTYMPATGKLVIQYPPGTGALLALFPEGHQVAGLYTSSCLVVLLLAILLITRSQSWIQAIACSLLGAASVLFFVSPLKSSYSAAPSVALCAVLGFLTPALFDDRISRVRRLALFAAAGAMLGGLVDLRIANVLLSGGYAVVLLVLLLARRTGGLIASCGTMAVAFMIGISPTLMANWVNAGSPFRTTYGTADTQPPELTWGPLTYYMNDVQGFLLVIALVGSVAVFVKSSRREGSIAAAVAFLTAAISAIFFFTHTLVTPYYLMPAAMLSLWIVVRLFADQSHHRIERGCAN